jgi:hypothetical protein
VKKQRKQAMIDELVRSVILEFLSWHFFPWGQKTLHAPISPANRGV